MLENESYIWQNKSGTFKSRWFIDQYLDDEEALSAFMSADEGDDEEHAPSLAAPAPKPSSVSSSYWSEPDIEVVPSPVWTQVLWLLSPSCFWAACVFRLISASRSRRPFWKFGWRNSRKLESCLVLVNEYMFSWRTKDWMLLCLK